MTGDPLPDDTGRIDPIPIRVMEARRIQAMFGDTTVWFGFFTREWWALLRDDSRLVEGGTPDRLGEAITEARRPDADA